MRTALMIPLGLVLTGCLGGGGPSVGLVLGRDSDTRSVLVRKVPAGQAGDLAGLLPGDEVLMIDGLYVRDLEAKQIKERLHGEAGTMVALTVVREGEVRHLRLKRGAHGQREAPKPKEEQISE